MRAHEISRCLLGQPSQMSIYAGGTVAISLFSKLSVYAGGVAGNVGLCGVNFAFFQNSQSMRGVSVEFLDLCGVSLVLFSLIVIISKGASHEFSVCVRPSVRPSVVPCVRLSVRLSVRPSVRVRWLRPCPYVTVCDCPCPGS